jgi:cation diffusion facilitator family transporter
MITPDKLKTARSAVLIGGLDLLATFASFVAARSSVLLADFLKTFLEFIAVFLAFLVIRRISGTAHRRFEYGFEKLEDLSSLITGSVMIAVVLTITTNAIINILRPSQIAGVGIWISLTAQVVFGVINGVMWWKARQAARTSRSPLVESQAELQYTKAAGNIFILFALVGSLSLANFGWSVYIDPVASLLIAGMVLMSAVGVFKSSVNELLDRTLEEADQVRLLRVLAGQFDHYDEFFGTRTRRAGGREFIEVFLGYDPDRTIREVQVEMDEVRHAIEREFKDASVVIVLTGKDITRF